MNLFFKILNWLSSLKVAIGLLLIIALSSALGTAIPQAETPESYIKQYAEKPFIGFINGETLLKLELDHVYSSNWFLLLLLWLGISLMICSFRRQLPTLKAAIRWVDYKQPKQIERLAIARTLKIKGSSDSLENLACHLNKKGWKVKEQPGRIAARKGVIGRIGPPLIHFGLILLMIGSTYGVLKGQKLERFISPGKSIEILSPKGRSELAIQLEEFHIERGPTGQPEQFISKLALKDRENESALYKEISVNHPLRYRGITLYQADWSLAAITLQINNSPRFQIPLKNIPELGEEVWGLILPSIKEEDNQLLLTIKSEEGPIQVFDESGESRGFIRPNQGSLELEGKSIKVFDILPNSGIILKYDPGVPLVYMSFAIILIGSILSIISTKQIWAIAEDNIRLFHIGGITNRDVLGFANEFPSLIKEILKE